MKKWFYIVLPILLLIAMLSARVFILWQVGDYDFLRFIDSGDNKGYLRTGIIMGVDIALIILLLALLRRIKRSRMGLFKKMVTTFLLGFLTDFTLTGIICCIDSFYIIVPQGLMVIFVVCWCFLYEQFKKNDRLFFDQ